MSGGERFPARYDRRHDISLTGSYQLSEGMQLSGNWVFGTGNAVSLASASYLTEPQVFPYFPEGDGEVEFFDGRNSVRMRSYHRLDLSLQYIRRKGIRERTLTVGLYNIYNRKNPFFYFFSEDEDEPGVRQISLFPMIPAISYSYGF